MAKHLHPDAHGMGGMAPLVWAWHPAIDQPALPVRHGGRTLHLREHGARLLANRRFTSATGGGRYVSRHSLFAGHPRPILLSALLLAALAAPQAAADKDKRVARVSNPCLPVRTAIAAGTDFLIKDQNPDGSWGGPQNAVYTFTGPVWSNPETHRAWKVATTGLCCMALMEVGESATATAALDRGIDYLLANSDVKRPSEWDTMNSWAYIYGAQALAEALTHPRYAESSRREQIRAAGQQNVDGMARFQSINGGWGYLEFDAPRTRRPQWATSFTTAAAIVALVEAKEAGLVVDQKVIDRAVRVVNHCRLPNGAYTYRVRNVPNLHSEYIDQVKGSLSRIQVCQEALAFAGEPITLEQFQIGLRRFFRDHRFLDIACNKPIPHENYYYNSGYFYLFGHYYAARAIERLSPAEQAVFWPALQREIIKMQQKDGSMWDYDMHNYHKPYGIAFGLMALGRSVKG